MTTVTPPTESAKPYLSFKFLVVTALSDLAPAQFFQPPARMINRPLDDDKVISGRGVGYQHEKRENHVAVVPEFDLDFVHRIELKDERPRIPKRREGMSEGFYSQLCDRAYQVAAEAKVANDEIRRRVDHYVERGLIEIVSDPFRGESEIEEWAELAALPEPAKTTEIKVRKLAS
jgi:hypothetical protein